MVIMLAILENRRSGWLSILIEEFEENTEDEDATIVELIAAAIVSVIDGSDTMKSFVTQRITKKNSMKKKNREEDRRAERENEIERKHLLDWNEKCVYKT